MPLFAYKAKDRKGKIVEEVIQATDRKEAASILKSRSLQVLTLRNLEAKIGSLFQGKISTSDKASFCRFLATMLRAGLSLPEGIEIIAKEAQNERLKKILLNVAFQTRKGSSLSAVLAQYQKDFGAVFLTMVKAGEESGTLDKSFDYLARQLLASYEMAQKVKGALMYPAVIVVAMMGNAVVMFTFVLPKISEVFSKMDFDLPITTRIVLAAGNFVGNNTLLVFGVIFLLLVMAVLTVVIRPTRSLILSILTKIPVVRKLRNQIDVSRFSRTLSTLLKTGVPIMEALDVSANVLDQPRLRAEAKKFSAGVAEGESLSDLLDKTQKVFPRVMTQTVRAGEKTGTLENVLLEMAEFYEKEVDFSLKRLTSIIEPVLMLVIGVAVGAMILMMVVPIYSLVGGFEGAN